MSQPRVSVVMPVYNAEPFLRESLDSVCRQTLHDIEIICVNDGSTDGSLGIIEEYANRDERIVVLDGPNGGYGRAMNRGFAAATGEYVGIVEPDDYIALTMYEDLYQLAHDHALDFVKADFYQFRCAENGNMFFEYRHLDASDVWYGKVFDPSESPETLMFLMNTWTGIYRRAFIEEMGIRHNETPGASYQDNGFWFQTFVLGKRAMLVSRPYYRYRVDNPNSSINDKGKAYCMAEEYDYIEGLLKARAGVWEKVAPWYWALRFNNYMFTLGRIDQGLVPEYMRHFQETFARARQMDELDQSVFTPVKWKKLKFILDHPQLFGRLSVAKRPLRKPRDKTVQPG